MNGTQNGAMKGYLITFGLTLVATIIAGIIVEKFIRSSDERALAQKAAAAQPPRQVTVVTEEKVTNA